MGTIIQAPGGAKLCPSEYMGWIYRPEGEEVIRDQGKCYPYLLQLSRWVDLGDYRKEQEPEEFRALTAGQVCCDHLTRCQSPPIDCQWQGRDWSTIPSMADRMETLLSGTLQRLRKLAHIHCVQYLQEIG